MREAPGVLGLTDEGFVKKSPAWDKKNLAIQVTDAQHESMELRIVCGAENPGDASVSSEK